MTNKELLDILLHQNQEISDTVENHFSKLKDSQLNWTPAVHKWSILQCLEHIYISGRFYIDSIETKLSQLEPDSTLSAKKFRPGLIGDFFAKSMKPKAGRIKYKTKTFERTKPSAGNLDPEKIIYEFFKFQNQVHNTLRKAGNYDLERIKINSLMGSILKFNLGDSLRVVLSHNIRHILQAQQVRENPDFPRQ